MKLHPLLHLGDDITQVRTELKSNIELLHNAQILNDVFENISKDEVLSEQFCLPILAGTAFLYFSPEDGIYFFRKLKKVINRANEAPFQIELSSILFTEWLWILKTEKEPSFSKQLQREYQRLVQLYDLSFSSVLDNEFIISQPSSNFSFFFALLLRQMPISKVHAFLNYQTHRFEGDFRGFLEGVLIEYNTAGFYEQKTLEAAKTWLVRSLSKIPIGASPNQHEEMGLGEKKQIVIQELSFLKTTNEKGERILFEQDYERLLEYCFHLVTHLRLPNIEHRIHPKGVINIKIRYAFYKIHKQIWGTRIIHEEVIAFIHEVFPQFRGDRKTTLKKFSIPPKDK